MALTGLLIGGALGTLARYLVAQASPYPLGTVIVNVIGCFLLALISGNKAVPPGAQLALGTGFLGAFTTYTTFMLESHLLGQQGAQLKTLGYLAANLGVGYVALLLGRAVAGLFSN